MDSLQIIYFLKVAEDLNYTRASEKLFVSQSAVSKKIASLEKELGYPLFIRDHHRVILTENGKHMQKFFSRMLKEYQEEKELALLRIHQEDKSIKIGVIEGYNLSFYTKHFHDECSFLEYRIDFDRIDPLLKSLSNGEFDLVIGQFKGIQQSLEKEGIQNIAYEAITKIKRIIYFSKTNPLYNKENLSLKDFEDQPFYIGTSKVARKNAEEICEKEGVNPTLVPTLHASTMEFKVSSGLGFALGDDYSRIKKDQDFAYIHIPHEQLIGGAYRKDISTLKKKYIQEVLNIFKNYHFDENF